MNAKQAKDAKLHEFEVLFGLVESDEHRELIQECDQVAELSEPIRALAEATAEIARPRFSTFVSD